MKTEMWVYIMWKTTSSLYDLYR